MELYNYGVWTVRRRLGWVTPEEIRQLQYHYARKACVEMARQTCNVVAAFGIGAMLPAYFHFGYSLYHLNPSSTPLSNLNILYRVSVVSGCFCSLVAMRHSQKVLSRRLVGVYDPDTALFNAFTDHLRDCFHKAISILSTTLFVATPYLVGVIGFRAFRI